MNMRHTCGIILVVNTTCEANMNRLRLRIPANPKADTMTAPAVMVLRIAH